MTSTPAVSVLQHTRARTRMQVDSLTHTLTHSLSLSFAQAHGLRLRLLHSRLSRRARGPRAGAHQPAGERAANVTAADAAASARIALQGFTGC
eukprot:848583-Pleurochrysis_carterae.AAC.1